MKFNEIWPTLENNPFLFILWCVNLFCFSLVYLFLLDARSRIHSRVTRTIAYSVSIAWTVFWTGITVWALFHNSGYHTFTTLVPDLLMGLFIIYAGVFATWASALVGLCVIKSR